MLTWMGQWDSCLLNCPGQSRIQVSLLLLPRPDLYVQCTQSHLPSLDETDLSSVETLGGEGSRNALEWPRSIQASAHVGQGRRRRPYSVLLSHTNGLGHPYSCGIANVFNCFCRLSKGEGLGQRSGLSPRNVHVYKGSSSHIPLSRSQGPVHSSLSKRSSLETVGFIKLPVDVTIVVLARVLGVWGPPVKRTSASPGQECKAWSDDDSESKASLVRNE